MAKNYKIAWKIQAFCDNVMPVKYKDVNNGKIHLRRH